MTRYLKYAMALSLALIACFVLAPAALAHHPVGSASQSCDQATGDVILNAPFDNPGFTTQVTATDSQAGVLGTETAPITFSAEFPGPDRAAGTVSFHWVAEHDQGTVTASYEAVSGCEAPPPTTTTTTTTTAPPPPAPHHNGGPPTHIGTAPHGSSPPPAPAAEAAPAPAGVQNGALPFSGYPLVPLLLMTFGLIGGGIALGALLDIIESRRNRTQ